MNNLKHLLQNISEGPWEVDIDGQSVLIVTNTDPGITIIGETEKKVDAELIVYMRNNAQKLSVLIDAVEEYIKAADSKTVEKFKATAFYEMTKALDALNEEENDRPDS